MNLEIANKAIEAAICESKRLKVNMNIAIVDAGANLVAFSRMDNSLLGAVDISIKKAKTAALFQKPSGLLGQMSQPGKPVYGLEHSNGGVITFPGGVPIFDGKNVLIGGIGVSSTSSDGRDDSRRYDMDYNDESIANVGKNAAK